jgi:alpha-beta hydrolase superfamily lysophospholipase
MLVREYFTPKGFEVALPSVTVPSLARLSPNAAIQLIVSQIRALHGRDLIVMGSSFGAFIALHAINSLGPDDREQIVRLVFLAPALNPWDPQSGLLTPERERVWREVGSAPLVDGETGCEVNVHYQFVEELRALNSTSVSLSIPTLIIHGIEDEVVPVSQSQEFAQQRGGVTLELVHDTHQLLKNPKKMLESIERFILSDSTDSR